jgi:uncharacterized membrane protein YphA (DoxX/SURF4 family)
MTSSHSQSPPSDLINRPKTYPHRSLKRTAIWGATLVVATIYIAASVPKLGGFGFFDARFEQWGYPYWFELTVGVIEATAAIFLIIPTTAFYSALALAVIMVGAIFTHLVFGQAALAVVPLIMLCLLAFIGWMRRPAWVHRRIRQRKVLP